MQTRPLGNGNSDLELSPIGFGVLAIETDHQEFAATTS